MSLKNDKAIKWVDFGTVKDVIEYQSDYNLPMFIETTETLSRTTLSEQNGVKTQPFLKWAGGKTQLLPILSKYVPTSYNRYIEPFLGAGAFFFHLQPKDAILADLNDELINCFEVVRDDIEALLDALQRYRNEEKHYYKIRRQDPDKLASVTRAARTIFLNKTCFNGLFRVNKNGSFNVPFANRKNPKIVDEVKLKAAHHALQGVKLICGDYKEVLRKYAKPGDFIYLDPPYYPVGGYSDFKRYTKSFFYEEDHYELRDEFRRLVNKGCLALLTNSNTDFVRKLYDEFEYKVVDSKRLISSNASTRTGEDLIVIATKPIQKTASSLALNRVKLLENFPGTRYMGSKYRVLPFIWQCVKDLEFDSVLDAFSGSGCVSYMFKQFGKRVVSNDFMNFTYHFSKALVENNNVLLSEEELQYLMAPNPNAGTFISETFKGLYFTDKENEFLDSLRANIDLIDNPYKKSIALAATARACLKRRPRGIFTFVGDRYDDGRRDMQLSLEQHFEENVHAFNAAVFDNGQNNLALNKDVFDLTESIDLVYLDPPYYTPISDNDYTRRYHFIEGFTKNWEGLEIQQHTKTKKFKRYATPFISPDTIHDAFERLFAKFKNSIIVLSYSSNCIPQKAELVTMLKKYKSKVHVHQVEHLYSFGTHGHKVGDNANRVKEFVFVAY